MNTRTAFQKKYLLLLLCYMIGATTLSVIAPILPYQMKEKNIPESSTGLIFCIFSVAGFVGAQICDPHLDLEVETGGDSRFSVFLGSRSKFTLGAEKKGYLHLSPLQDPDVDH